MICILVFMLLIFSAGAEAAEWTQADVWREISYDALLTSDMLMTRNAMHAGQYREINPIVGDHPSDGRLYGWLAAGGAVHWLISNAFPSGANRNAFQYITIGIEGFVVAHNYRIGLRMSF
jgi:hypothetical protein